MNRTERILEILDQGIGSSMEPGYGLIVPDRCTRCVHRDPVDGSDFCEPCRTYLLGDGPEQNPGWEAAFPADGLCDVRGVIQRSLDMPSDRHVAQNTDSDVVAANAPGTVAAMERFSQAFMVSMTSAVEAFNSVINAAAPGLAALADLLESESIAEPTPELVEAMNTYGTRPEVDGSQLERFNQVESVRERGRFTYRPVWPGHQSYSHGR